MATVKEFVVAFNSAHIVTEEANKAEFTSMRTLLKDKVTRVAVAKEIKKEAEALINLNSRRRELKSLVDNTIAFFAIPDRVVNYGLINYANLKRVVALSKYITKHYEGDMDKLTILDDAYEAGISDYRYNNKLEDIAKELKEEIKVETVVEYTDVYKTVETLTVADKTKLLEALMGELGYTVEEVA